MSAEEHGDREEMATMYWLLYRSEPHGEEQLYSMSLSKMWMYLHWTLTVGPSGANGRTKWGVEEPPPGI